MNITPNSITCVNGYKYGYKYALHYVLNECYDHNKNIFLVTSDCEKLNNEIFAWQSFNNKYLNRSLVDIGVGIIYSLNHIATQPEFKNSHLIILLESYYTEGLKNMGVTKLFPYITVKHAKCYYERFTNLIKNNLHSVIFINNCDYDPLITNFMRENVTCFIDCEIHKNVLGVKEDNMILYYEYKKLKGGYKVIGNKIDMSETTL